RSPRRGRRLPTEPAGVPGGRRTARYVAVVARALPGGAPDSRSAVTPPAAATRLFRAACDGRIASAMRGPRGFGYDPIFFYPPFSATFGEIAEEETDRVSHRGLALAKVAAFLKSPEGKAFLPT